MHMIGPAWNKKTASAPLGAVRPTNKTKEQQDDQSRNFHRRRLQGQSGPGGWGALLVADGAEKEIFGGEPNTTNNRMELQAVIEALMRAQAAMHVVTLHTDSQYVQKGISEWIHGWKARGWKTAAKEPVKNEDLWKALDAAQAAAHGRMALGARPQRPPRQRARRHAGQPRRGWPGQALSRPVILHRLSLT
jgi:ribonuclease HI